MIAFIDSHREGYGVESICKVLPIAPSTYYTHKARERDPSKVPDRVKRDEKLKVEIRRVWDENFQVYGVRKMWRQLRREGMAVARCTVARLNARSGLAWRGSRSPCKDHDSKPVAATPGRSSEA